MNLIEFPLRDSVNRRSASWRDSDAGYAGGRFAMDVNAVWVPQALDATAAILAAFPRLGLDPGRLASIAPEIGRTALTGYIGDTLSLRRAIETWRHARRHFEVTLGPREVGEQVGAKLAWLPEVERRYWENVMVTEAEPRDSLAFLALSLDAEGRPIPIVNTDPATGLFLEDRTAGILAGRESPESVLRDVAPFVRTFPVALFAGGLGPLAANDAYASKGVWERFEKDRYHGPRVVWGREVNLLFLGLANQPKPARRCFGEIPIDRISASPAASRDNTKPAAASRARPSGQAMKPKTDCWDMRLSNSPSPQARAKASP
jgi:hypothetical protein